MTSILTMATSLALALQGAPEPTTPAPEAVETLPPIASFDELPIEQSARARCAIAFSIVGRWQVKGDSRGANYEDVEENGGREFFIQTLGTLMIERGMDEDAMLALVFREVEELAALDDGAQVEAMMPACLIMKEAAGL